MNHPFPDILRTRLRPLLPPQAFLRRSRSGGLFVTDGLRHSAEDPTPLLEAAGFRCRRQGDLLILTPCERLLTDFEAMYPHPPDVFCASVARLRGLPLHPDATECFSTGLRLLESSLPEERRRYHRDVRQLAALCLRCQTGGIYACALIDHRLSSYDDSPQTESTL